jgi:hypothetical protein
MGHRLMHQVMLVTAYLGVHHDHAEVEPRGVLA